MAKGEPEPTMNSVNNTFDSTSKINLLDHQSVSSSPSPIQRRNRNLIKIFFCLVIFLALIIGAILLYLIHKNNVNSQIQFNSKQNNEAIEIFCSITNHHFPQCITSLSSSIPTNGRNKMSPDDIFSLSLILASNELNNLASLTKSLILISTDSRSVSTLQKCASLIDDSVHKLNKSLTAYSGFEFFGRYWKMFGQEKIRDIRHGLNDSFSDLKSCFDLLVKKDESRAVDSELRGKVQMAMIYASNNFDFLQNRDGIINLIESWNDQKSVPVMD